MILLTCPFCGCDAYEDEDTADVIGSRTGMAYAIACSWCGATAPGADTFINAKLNWNKRTTLNGE